MKTHSLLFLVCMASAVHAGVPISRTVDVSATIKPIALESYAGETLDLSVQLASGGAALATPSASATIYWQTNGMANAWWQTNMSCSASGLVTGSWSPGLPSGRVWFFVGVESSGLNYRVSGQCSILPSPGGAPSTAVLPPPGSTLNLGDYTIIGAPWITSSDSAAAIASATDPLASEISALSERAASAATSASNYTDSVAAPLIAATNSITERLDAIDIPDVSGFASKTSLQAASNSLAEAVQQLSSDLTSATNELHTSLAPTISAASTALQPSATNSLLTSLAPTIQLASTALQPSASNALAQAIAALEQTMAYNAQQSGYDLSSASNALAQAIAALSQTVSYNAQQSGYDLSAVSNALSQAIAALSQTVTYNAQQSSSDLISATNALHTSLAPTVQLASTALQPTATNALAQATADLAQKVEGLSIAASTSNTALRLMSLDGQIYQDATGTVWRLRNLMAPGLFRLDTVQYYTNGVMAAETNELPGVELTLWEGYDNGAWEILAGESGREEDVGERYREWRDFTNHVAAADMEDTTNFYYLAQLVVAGEEYELKYVGGISESPITFEWPMTEQYKTRLLNFSRTNVTASVWTPADQVLYASTGGGTSSITTNDVCNIVTNTTPLTLDWKFSGPGIVSGVTYAVTAEWFYNEDIEGYEGDIYLSADGSDIDGPYTTPSDPNVAGFSYYFESAQITATRISLPTRNSLGLARLIDLPPLTNGLPEAIAAKASTNDVLLTPVYSKTPAFSEWVCEPAEYDGIPFSVVDDVFEGEYWMLVWGGSVYAQGYSDSTSLTWNAYGLPSVTATRTRTDIIGYTLGTQTNKVLASTSITNGLSSAGSVAAASAAASAAQSMAVAASNTASSVAGTVAAWETYWDGDEVRVTVTNYDSAVHLPSLYIEQKLENTNAYRTVWDERTRWASNDVQMAEMRSAIDEKADRAWGFYDSNTGEYAPDGYTWLSSPKIAIAGGLAYQRTLTTSGAIWVLVSNGLVAQTGGDTNGFFRIKDDEGNTTFELVRGNKRTVGATAAGIKVTSPRNSPTVTIEIPYNVVSDASPTLYGTANLSSPEWTQLSPQWLGQSGAWTAIVTSASSQYFVKGEYEVGGETYIKNIAPISVESGIYCTDGVHKVRPVYNNGTITWEVVQ